MLRRVYFLFAFALFGLTIAAGLDRLLHRGGTKFSLRHVHTSNLFSSEFSIPALSLKKKQQLEEVFSQKFLPYNKGIRSEAFISEDGRYVLHFLRRQSVKAKSFLAYLPFAFNPYYHRLLDNKKHAMAAMQAWHRAFLDLQEEMALVYVHFDNQERLNHKVLLLDENLESHYVDLDKTLFYVQRHADLFYLKISDFIHNQEWEKAKEAVDSVYTLLESLFEKGALDTKQLAYFEPFLVDNRAVQLDLGPLYPRDRLPVNCSCHRRGDCSKVLFEATERMRFWIEQHAPWLQKTDQLLESPPLGQ